jgi:hypothetical protein
LQTKKVTFDYEKGRLTHRFFIYDTVSGIDNTGGYARGDPPKVVRMATSVHLTVELDSKTPESIRKPLLTIEYKEIKTAKIAADTKVDVDYFLDYYEGTSRIWRALRVIFIVANFLCLIIVAIRLYFFITHNRPKMLGPKFAKAFILNMFYFLFDVWSTIMFWVSFFTTFYWFVFYKMQKNAKLLLPSTVLLN